MIICFNGSGTYTQNWTQWHICTVYCNSNNNHTACCMQPRQVYKVHTEYLKQITEITVSEINTIMTVTEKNGLHMRDSASSASPPLPCSLVEPPPDAWLLLFVASLPWHMLFGFHSCWRCCRTWSFVLDPTATFAPRGPSQLSISLRVSDVLLTLFV